MTTTETLAIDGMSCDHCVRAVREALERLDGVDVEHVAVGEARVRMDDASASRDAIEAVLADEGYTLAG